MGLLDGRIAVITGAARGIGAAAAERFVKEGASVVITDLDAAPLVSTQRALEALGGRVEAVAGDMTDPAFPGKVVSTALRRFGGWHILVNNAGYNWDATFGHTTDDMFEAMLGVHLLGPVRLLRAAYPSLEEAAETELATNGFIVARKVVFVSSITAIYGNGGQTPYASAKASLTGLAKSLAKDWGVFNVQVNCVAFGAIETRLTGAQEQGEQITRQGQVIPLGIPSELQERVKSEGALERFGTPEEAASALLFFSSSLSDFVTGQLLEVNGGFIG